MGWIKAWTVTLEFIFRIWDWVTGRKREKLLAKIDRLEVENRQHQLNGDLEQMRRTRGQLDEARRRLRDRDYE